MKLTNRADAGPNQEKASAAAETMRVLAALCFALACTTSSLAFVNPSTLRPTLRNAAITGAKHSPLPVGLGLGVFSSTRGRPAAPQGRRSSPAGLLGLSAEAANLDDVPHVVLETEDGPLKNFPPEWERAGVYACFDR